MKQPLVLVTMIALSGCATVSDSRFNPLNWFGRSQSTPVTAPAGQDLRPLVSPGELAADVDRRALIGSVTDLQVDPTPSGAIVTARGLAATQGFFNAELVRRGVDNGVLTFEFRVEAPAPNTPNGTLGAREITAATNLSSRDLVGIRAITVAGQTNSLQSSR